MTTQAGYFPPLGQVCLSTTNLQPGQILSGALDFGGYIVTISAPDSGVGYHDASIELSVYNTSAGTTDPNPIVFNGTGQFNLAQGTSPNLTVYLQNTGTMTIACVAVCLATNVIGPN